MTKPVPVLLYNHYMGPDSQTIYTEEHFCGACRRELEKPYGFRASPEDLEAKNASWGGLGGLDRRDDRDFGYWMFCPWCGVSFAEEWWKDRTIQNERPIDHFDDPGHHKGDTAIFPGTVEGHYLATTGDELCWCDPVVVPSILGCEIMHQDKPQPVRANAGISWDQDDDDDDAEQ